MRISGSSFRNKKKVNYFHNFSLDLSRSICSSMKDEIRGFLESLFRNKKEVNDFRNFFFRSKPFDMFFYEGWNSSLFRNKKEVNDFHNFALNLSRLICSSMKDEIRGFLRVVSRTRKEVNELTLKARFSIEPHVNLRDGKRIRQPESRVSDSLRDTYSRLGELTHQARCKVTRLHSICDTR